MANLRKRINARLVNDKKDFLKYTSRPIYIRFTVLELSKWLMYDFHYRFIRKHFDAELLLTDTYNLMK